MLQETRIVLRHMGKTNPISAEEYGMYASLRKALEMPALDVVGEVNASKLRGRGGAGFPAGKKWEFVLYTDADQKYVVCNADEGEPGTNKDRVILSNDPHSVFEGMAIAGWAVGATQGFIYLRFEYPYVFSILEQALDSARAAGCLGKNIFGSGFDFDITVVSGGGAYVCGEETALLESIEGNRGEPRYKPPYPGISGLYAKPTLINNVETLANIPIILEKGGEWFSQIGTPSCTGTKLFTLCGNIAKPGIYEYPMGTNLKDIFEAHGGIKDGKGLLGFMLGGQSGSLINASQIDVAMDIDSCQNAGFVLGTGTIMAIDDTTDILELTENIMSFFVEESCGKCTPCREGNARIYEVLQRICRGDGNLGDLDLLGDLTETMSIASFCGLGQSSGTAVITGMQNFKEDYLSAVERGRQA
ncbi:MAG: NADH-quinone oxidoreductase subunit NuoF [Eubacteriaceae bacterium]|nr:NADH-quinone oxidoreductase subunit NuoF [Eubacteriaceae bacterium]